MVFDEERLDVYVASRVPFTGATRTCGHGPCVYWLRVTAPVFEVQPLPAAVTVYVLLEPIAPMSLLVA